MPKITIAAAAEAMSTTGTVHAITAGMSAKNWNLNATISWSRAIPHLALFYACGVMLSVAHFTASTEAYMYAVVGKLLYN